MNITFKKLISMFLDGAIEGVAGTKNNPGNLKIKGQQLLHYNTVILEKRESELIINQINRSVIINYKKADLFCILDKNYFFYVDET